MTTVRTRKAQAKLEDIEPHEVSPVDRPANGHRFLIAKSEGGVASTSEEPMGNTAVQKNGVPAPEQAQMAQGGAPPAPMADATKTPGAPGAPEPEAPASTQEPPMADGPALVLPMGAKASLLGAVQAVMARLAEIAESLSGATEAEGTEMPSEPVVAIADAAGAMASAVEPYVMKQAGSGMAPPPPPAAGDTEVGKAEGGPWTPEYVDSLPDWSFLYVEPSTERDTDWRTSPLTNRKFPIRDHAGRLCLQRVVEAITQIGAGGEPFLSAQRKRKLLLNLADLRLDEAMVAAYRDEPMAPETAAELLAIAEMIVGIGQTGMPAAPAPAPMAGDQAAPAAPVGQAAPPPVEEQMAAFTKAVAGRLTDMVALRKAAVTKSDTTKLAEVSAMFKAAVAKLDEVAEPSEEGKAFPPKKGDGTAAPTTETAKSESGTAGQTPQVDVTKALQESQSETAKVQAELATTKVALGKAQVDLVAARSQLAKAERRVPSTNVDREEPASVAKAEKGSAMGHITDLNEVYKAEQQSATAK